MDRRVVAYVIVPTALIWGCGKTDDSRDHLPTKRQGDGVMMSDSQAIQGLWRLVSHVCEGHPVRDPATHYVFRDGRFTEIVPDLVDDGVLRSTYWLDEDADLKRIVVTLDYNGPDGPPDPDPIVEHGYYRLDGDRLQLCWGVDGGFPDEFSGRSAKLVTLERDYGPVPVMKKPSGRKPLEDEVLGRLVWDDNVNWYTGRFPVPHAAAGRAEHPVGRAVEVHLEADKSGSVDTALGRAKGFAARLAEQDRMAKDYAATELLTLKNDVWLADGEEPLDAVEFQSRMTLESIVFSPDGAVTLYYHDGGLFLGHSIQIGLDREGRFIHADIPG